MRKLLSLIAAILAACGSSSSSGPSYAVKDSAVAFTHGDSCPVTAFTGVTVGASLAIVELTDYTTPTACASMQGPSVAANGAAAGLLIARANFSTTGGAALAPPLTARKYEFFDLATLSLVNFPPFDTSGMAVFFTGVVATCGSGTAPPTEAKINGGTVTVTSVDASTGTIAGSVDATLAGGRSFKGTFSTASACSGVTLPVTVCEAVGSLALTLPTPTCL